MYQYLKAFAYGRITHRAEAKARKAEVVRLVREAHVYLMVFNTIMGEERA